MPRVDISGVFAGSVVMSGTAERDEARLNTESSCSVYATAMNQGPCPHYGPNLPQTRASRERPSDSGTARPGAGRPRCRGELTMVTSSSDGTPMDTREWANDVG